MSIYPADFGCIGEDALQHLINHLSLDENESKSIIKASREQRIQLFNKLAAKNSQLSDLFADIGTYNNADGMSAMIRACQSYQQVDLYQNIDARSLAMLLITQYPAIFQNAKAFLALSKVHKWQYFKLISPLKVVPNPAKRVEYFRAAIAKTAKQLGFGDNYCIDCVNENHRFLVNVYYPGYLIQQPEIDTQNRLISRPHRKVFSAAFEYCPENGLLKLHTSSQNKTFYEALKTLFVQAFLVNPNNAQWHSGAIVDLSPLRTESFQKALNSTRDGVTEIRITKLKFAPSNNLTEPTLQSFDTTDCYTWLSNHDFDYQQIDFQELTLRFKFDSSLGRPITVRLKESDNSIRLLDSGTRASLIKAHLRPMGLLHD